MLSFKHQTNPTVAILDMRSDELRSLDWADVKGTRFETVSIPRFKNRFDVRLTRPGSKDKELVATVNLKSLGMRYNLHRYARPVSALYVVNI